jgi:hypothetical protein
MKARQALRGVGLGRRALRVEFLEQRAMLAGNVNVFVEGGNLIVRGDNQDNLVLIEQVGDGEYAVTGFDFADSGLPGVQTGPTRINGEANGTVIVEGVTGDVNVDLRRGNDGLGIGNSVDDLLALADECGFGLGIGGGGEEPPPENGEAIVLQQQVDGRFFVPRNLIVNTGDGNDGIAISADVEGAAIINTGNGSDAVAYGSAFELESDLFVGTDLVVLTGSGNDNVCALFVEVQGLINVQTGGGNDIVDLEEFDAGAVLVISGAGNDTVDINEFDTDRTVVVDTGAGNDFAFLDDFTAGQGFGPNEQEGAGYITVVTGAGNDEAELTNFDADGVVVDTGAGNDGTPVFDESPITVADAEITNHLVIVTGGGNDLVLVEFVEAGAVTIDTGAGNDGTVDFPVEVYNVLFDNLVLVTGGGNDNVYVHAGGGEDPSSIENNLIVNTGAGNDIVQVIEQTIGNDLNVSLGAGNDQAAIGADDEIGAGDIEVGMTVERNLLVDAGTGNDGLAIGDVDVLNDLFAFLGAGNDLLFTFGAEVGGNALIDAGAGNDNVGIFACFFQGDLRIFMGSGNDTLTIAGSGGEGRLIAFGGSGRDTFNNDLGIDSNGSNDFSDIFEFEEFNTDEEPV